MILSSGLSSPLKSHLSRAVPVGCGISVGMGERVESNKSICYLAPHTSVFDLKSLYPNAIGAIRALTTKVTTAKDVAPASMPRARWA